MRAIGVPCVALGLAAAACAQPVAGPQPNQDTVNMGLTRECIDSIAAVALANQRTNNISAHIAGRSA